VVGQILAQVNAEGSGVYSPEAFRARFPSVQWRPEYERGYADPMYWQSGAEPFAFRSKAWEDPILALEAFFRGPTIADSRSVMFAAQLMAQRHRIGDASFRVRYLGRPLDLQLDPGKDDLDRRMGLSSVDVGSGDTARRSIRPGDWVGFVNDPRYMLNHPRGQWSVIHMACVGSNARGEPLFSGFGLTSVTEREVYERFIVEYNRPGEASPPWTSFPETIGIDSSENPAPMAIDGRSYRAGLQPQVRRFRDPEPEAGAGPRP